MKVALLTMFSGLSPTYSLVNVAADQIRMLLGAGVSVKMLVSETCPDGERTGIFADERLEWVKVTNTLHGQPIRWHDYSSPTGQVHDTFFEEAHHIAKDFVTHLKDVDVCILHDILYQGWHLVHNIAVRKAQQELPHLRFLAFTHSFRRPGPRRWNIPSPPGLPTCPGPNLSTPPARASQPWPGSTMCRRGGAPWSTIPCP